MVYSYEKANQILTEISDLVARYFDLLITGSRLRLVKRIYTGRNLKYGHFGFHKEQAGTHIKG